MTLDEVILLIQTWIVENGNEEITADVLRPILEAMVNQPNDLIGDLDNLTTTDKDNLVEAINEVRSLAITNAGLVIHSGSGTPEMTPPVSFGLGDFYAQVIFPSPDVESFWQYNGSVWVEQRPQRTRTVLKFVSLVGVTTAGKSQVEWMAEAINLNISNGAVYECEPGDIIDFYVNLLEDPNNDTPLLKRVFTRLITGETSVTSVDENDLMPDGSEDVPIDSELIIELGDIGTDNVWDAFNTDVNQPFAMDNEMFVSAIQDSEPKLWQWIGGTGLFGSTETPAVESDFLDLTEQPPITTYQLFRKYDDIAAMLADQSTQIAQQGILVLDASADPNITFPVGLDAEKKYAYYQKKAATTTGNISDYRLISAPYGNHSGELEKVTEGGNTGYRIKGRNPANYGDIGDNAVDFSASNSASATRGATGARSVAFGLNNSNNSANSLIYGSGNIIGSAGNPTFGQDLVGGLNNRIYASSYNNIISGVDNKLGIDGASQLTAVAYDSIVTGRNNNIYGAKDGIYAGVGLLSGSAGVSIVGVANEDISPNTANSASASIDGGNKPRFIVGNGTVTYNDNIVLTRSNAFVILQSGLITAPSLTTALIDAESTGRAIVTRNALLPRTHTGTVIPLDNPMGSVNNTATWNATYTLGTLVAGGNAINIIDTTGQTVFPEITGATLLSGSAFEADKIYEMHTYTYDGTNAFYFFLIRE